MKTGYTILNEEYNTLTGETTVVINTDYGTFTGTVKLDNDDAEYPSIFHANELATAKALRKFAKRCLLITKEKIKPLKAILVQCAYINEHTWEYPFGKATFLIRKEIEKLEKEKALWEKRIMALTESINSRIAERDKIIKRYKDKKD